MTAGFGGRYALLLLFLVAVFNLMDRQILSILLEPIKVELGASDSAMGLLTGFAFVSFYTVTSLPLARLADTGSRRAIIAWALTFWSILTALSGLVTSFGQLALARIGVGVGEAGTGPASQSLVSDLFPPERRTGALSWLAVGATVGVMTAFIVGGRLNQVVGWRATLILVGLAGLVLGGIVSFTLREPRRGSADCASVDQTVFQVRETLAYLWSLRSLRHLTLGASLSTFTGWSMVVWSPSYLIRTQGMDTGSVGTALGLATGLGGVTGTLLCGLLAQRLGRKDPRWILRVPAITSLLTLPFVVLFLTAPTIRAAIPLFFGIILFAPAMLGPVMAATQSVAKPRMRAMAAALVMLTFNLIGTGLGPLTAGVLSDLLEPRYGAASLRYALLLCGIASFGAALHFLRGAKHLPADLERTELGT